MLAGHASVALVNARLYEAQRREAESAKALLELSRELSSVHAARRGRSTASLAGAARILGVPRASVWLPTRRRRGELVCHSSLADATTIRLALSPATGCRRARADAVRDQRPSRSSSRRATTPHVVGPRPRRTLADTYAVAPITLESGWARARRRARAETTCSTSGSSSSWQGSPAQAKLALTNARSLREPRADVPLDRRGARQRPRGEGRVHVVPRPLDQRTWRSRSARSSGSTPTSAEARRARGAVPRHRQDRDPGSDPDQAGPADRRGAGLIETHPELGERILAPIEQLEHVRPIVRACHERYDGVGYPDRLAGGGDPARGADHLRLRRVPRDDDDAALPRRRSRSRRHGGACSRRPGRSSTPRSSRSASACSRPPTRPQPDAERAAPPASPRAAGAAATGLRTSTSPRTGTSQAPGSSSGLGGRQLERPAPAEPGRRQPERERVLPGVEEDEERVVDDRLSVPRLGRDLRAVEERPERGGVAALPVARASSHVRRAGTTRRPERPSPLLVPRRKSARRKIGCRGGARSDAS